MVAVAPALSSVVVPWAPPTVAGLALWRLSVYLCNLHQLYCTSEAYFCLCRSVKMFLAALNDIVLKYSFHVQISNKVLQCLPLE